MIYSKKDFKRLWEANDYGSGITRDDIADCAEAWGISRHPRTRPQDEITYKVLKAAQVKDAEEFNPHPTSQCACNEISDEKEQKLRELSENLRKLVPTMLFIGATEGKHLAMMMASPEKTIEERAKDVAATIGLTMKYNSGVRQILLAAVSSFLERNPDYQARMYKALAKMKQKPLPVPAGEA